MNIIYKNISLFFVLILFNFLAINVWQNIYKTHILGDEPHYIVIASAIADYGEFETTKAYTKDSNRKALSSPSFQPEPPKKGQNYLYHSLASSHGLYSIHNIGLPLIIAPFFKLYGVSGVKIFLILFFSTSIILLWKFMSTLKTTQTDKILLTIVTIFAFPFLTASNQIYPSLPSAIISLLSIIWILHRHQIKKNKLYIYDLIILAIIAYQPWLQIKFLAPALISTIAIVLANNYSNLLKKFLLFVPIVLSIILLALYNNYAFDNVFGPYSQGSLVINKTALIVLLGLHIDQFQGVFLQNPIMFIGLLFLIPFFKWNWKIAILTILLYLSMIVPNAMHPCWYGGYSYAGRFAWGSSLIWTLPIIFGLMQIKKMKPFIFYLLIGLSILLQVYFMSKFIYSDFSLYNNGVKFLETVNTFYTPFQYYFPSFSDDRWAYTYGTNYAYVLLFLSMIFIGNYYKKNHTEKFIIIIKLYFPIMFIFIFIVSFICSTTPPRFLGQFFSGQIIACHPGVVNSNLGTVSSQISKAGYITVGPNIKLPAGKYNFDINYLSPENNTTSVGTWDITVVLEKNKHILNKGNLLGTNKKNSHLVKSFTISKEYSNKELSIRTFYNGSGSLTIKSLTIIRVF